MNLNRNIFFLVFVLFVFSCKTDTTLPADTQAELSDPVHFQNSVEQLTDILVHDIFSPPVASRVYVYPCIAAYETLQQHHADQQTLAGQLNGLAAVPAAADTVGLSYELAAIAAFIETGKKLIFSEAKMLDYETALKDDLRKKNVPDAVVEKSFGYGHQVAGHILDWADKDRYKETRSAPKFSISDNPGEWKPTPPAYMEGIEPYWRDIRPMVIKNAAQFQPAPPPPFDMQRGSDFYNLVMGVKQAVDTCNHEQRAIASFWDCNPYVMNQKGHMMFASKKITPGGHWMGIAGIASKNAGHDLMKTIEATTMTAIALFDGFISCWDEKYRSNLIRPETVINEYVDEEWMPVLQTPPFPEHTSGHSVISSAAAVVLTGIVGDNLPYTDDVEVKYGLPERQFTSFLQAADEAAISRLYGGIHYMPAITDGVSQGKKVGGYILENVQTRRNDQLGGRRVE